MPFYFFAWTDETVEHLAEHGVMPEEFEEVLCDPMATETSRTTGRPVALGFTAEGRYLVCVYEHADADTIIPVTAYE